jgi:hypothetical protein
MAIRRSRPGVPRGVRVAAVRSRCWTRGSGRLRRKKMRKLMSSWGRHAVAVAVAVVDDAAVLRGSRRRRSSCRTPRWTCTRRPRWTPGSVGSSGSSSSWGRRWRIHTSASVVKLPSCRRRRTWMSGTWTTRESCKNHSRPGSGSSGSWKAWRSGAPTGPGWSRSFERPREGSPSSGCPPAAAFGISMCRRAGSSPARARSARRSTGSSGGSTA